MCNCEPPSIKALLSMQLIIMGPNLVARWHTLPSTNMSTANEETLIQNCTHKQLSHQLTLTSPLLWLL